MIRYRYGQSFPALPWKKEAVLSIGNFDGLHLGHQYILKETVAWARQEKLPPVAMIFDPHPSAVIGTPEAGEAGGFLLLSEPEERAAMIRDLGVEEVICLDFTRELSLLSAEEFCRQILKDWLRVRGLCVGHDFRLGYRRQGDEKELQRLGKLLGFTARFVEPQIVGGELVSSSRVRLLLQEGKVGEVIPLLGRPYHIKGNVVHGSARGEALGFKTANLAIAPHLLLPKNGVYASQVCYKNQWYPSVSNLGVRPTFKATAPEQQPQTHIESHLLDFQGDLYGEVIQLRFLERLRDEKRFNSPEELRQAIAKDVTRMRQILQRFPLQSES